MQELDQPQFAARDTLGNAELHQESVAELSFTRSLQKLLQLAVSIHTRDRKRAREWTNELSPKISRKCLSLGCSPRDEPLLNP